LLEDRVPRRVGANDFVVGLLRGDVLPVAGERARVADAERERLRIELPRAVELVLRGLEVLLVERRLAFLSEASCRGDVAGGLSERDRLDGERAHRCERYGQRERAEASAMEEHPAIIALTPAMSKRSCACARAPNG